MTHYICQYMCSTQSDQFVRDSLSRIQFHIFFFSQLYFKKKNSMQSTVQTAMYANSSYWAFLFWLYYAVHLFPGFTWRHLVLFWKAPWQVGWQRVPWQHSPNRGVCQPSVDNRLQIRTVFMKLILSTNFIKKLVMTGNSFVQVWWLLFCVGAGLTIGRGRPQLVIHRKWQKLWQIIGKRDVTDAPAESQMCPSCPALRMDTCVSLRLK